MRGSYLSITSEIGHWNASVKGVYISSEKHFYRDTAFSGDLKPPRMLWPTVIVGVFRLFSRAKILSIISCRRVRKTTLWLKPLFCGPMKKRKA